jgi:dihydrofolate reductase
MTDRPSTVVYVATSIDGFIARPDGGLDWLEPPGGEPDEETLALWAQFLGSIDHMVMGRKTFDTVLGFGEWPYDGVHVTVLSRTLQAVPAHLSDRADVSALAPRDLLRHLADQGRERVYVDGGQVIQGFLGEDLVDELILTRIPVLLGTGIPLFGDLEADLRWDHVDTRILAGGLVQTRYQRRR